MNRQTVGLGLFALLVVVLLLYIGFKSKQVERELPTPAVGEVAEKPVSPVIEKSVFEEDEVELDELKLDKAVTAALSITAAPGNLQPARIIEANEHTFQIPEIAGNAKVIAITSRDLSKGTNTQVVGGNEVEDGVFLYNSVTTEVTEVEGGKVSMTISSKSLAVDVSGGVGELEESEDQIVGSPEMMLTVEGDDVSLSGDGQALI